VFQLFRRRAVTTALATRDVNADAALTAPRMHSAVTPPIRRQGGGYTWSLESIRTARDAQLRGVFDQPVRMAEAFRTNDAMFTAYQARVATQSAIRLLWRAADSDSGRIACARAELSILTPQHQRESILGTLANHGVAIGYVCQTTADDPAYGPTTDMILTEWPLEHVRFNPSTGQLETRTKDNGTITITHGDGRWIVFRKFGVAPWTQDACVLPGALVWAAHGMAASDWAGASGSHGQPKVIGTLAEGVVLNQADALTPEAQALLNVITSLVNGDSAAGVLPKGAEAKLLFNGSTAWQVFDSLITNREKAAQRIYLGTDAALGSQGGAPGVDIASLFGIASTRIQGDLEALERGFREGMIEPWARMHGVPRVDMPTLTYAMPDADGERRSTQESAAMDRMASMVEAMKKSGFEVTQDTIDALAKILSVSVPCTLASLAAAKSPIQLAPTDVARVVKVSEARASQGLDPLGDERDDLFLSELEAKATADAAPPPAAPGAPGAFHVRADEGESDGSDEGESDGGDEGESDGGNEGESDEEAPPPPVYDWRAGLDDVKPIREQPIDGDGDGILNEEEKAIEKSRQRFLKKYDRFVAKQKKSEKRITEFKADRKAASDAADDASQESAKLLDSRDTPEGETAYQNARKREQRELNNIDRADDRIERETHRANDSDEVRSAFEDYNQSVREPASEAEEVLADLKTRQAESPDDPELKAAVAEAQVKYDEKQARYDALAPMSEKLEGDKDKPPTPDDVHEVAKAIQVGPKGGRYYVGPSGEKVYV
jgi:hypothetical protein